MENKNSKEAQYFINDWLKRTEVCVNIQDDSVSTSFITKEWAQGSKQNNKNNSQNIGGRFRKDIVKSSHNLDTVKEKVNNDFAIESIDQFMDKNKIAKQVVATLLKFHHSYDPKATMEKRHNMIKERKILRELEQKKRDQETKRREEIRVEATKLLEQEERSKMDSKVPLKRFRSRIIEKTLKCNAEKNEPIKYEHKVEQMEVKENLNLASLKKIYFQSWKNLMAERKIMSVNAKHTFSQKLLRKHLMAWKQYTFIYQMQNIKFAGQYYNYTILNKSLSKWKRFSVEKSHKKKDVTKRIKNIGKEKSPADTTQIVKSQTPKCFEISQERREISKRIISTKLNQKLIRNKEKLPSSKIHNSKSSSTNEKYKTPTLNLSLDHVNQMALESCNHKIKKQHKSLQNITMIQNTIEEIKTSVHDDKMTESNNVVIACQNVSGPHDRPTKSEQFDVNHLYHVVSRAMKPLPSAHNDIEHEHVYGNSVTCCNANDHLKSSDKISGDEIKSILSGAKTSKKSYILNVYSNHSTLLEDIEGRRVEREMKRKGREEKKRLLEEEKLAAIEKKRKAEEELKKKILNEVQERNKIEKERGLKKKLAEEKWNEQLKRADDMRKSLLIRYWGWKPWMLLIKMQHHALNKAQNLFASHLMRKIFITWRIHVKEKFKAREKLIDVFESTKLKRRYFYIWIKFHEEQAANWQRSCSHCNHTITRAMFVHWRHETKLSGDCTSMKLMQAQMHHKRQTMSRHLEAWKHFLSMLSRERKRETRLKHLREKIAQVIPDFSPQR